MKPFSFSLSLSLCLSLSVFLSLTHTHFLRGAPPSRAHSDTSFTTFPPRTPTSTRTFPTSSPRTTRSARSHSSGSRWRQGTRTVTTRRPTTSCPRSRTRTSSSASLGHTSSRFRAPRILTRWPNSATASTDSSKRHSRQRTWNRTAATRPLSTSACTTSTKSRRSSSSFCSSRSTCPSLSNRTYPTPPQTRSTRRTPSLSGLCHRTAPRQPTPIP